MKAKKVLALVLSLCLIVGLMPAIGVVAEDKVPALTDVTAYQHTITVDKDATDADVVDATAALDVGKYKTVEAAFSDTKIASNADGVVRILLASDMTAGDLSVADGTTVWLDLGGKTLTLGSANKLTNAGTLVVSNGTITNSGAAAVILQDDGGNTKNVGLFLESTAVVTSTADAGVKVEDGVAVINGASISGKTDGVNVVGTDTSAALYVNSGTITAAGTTDNAAIQLNAATKPSTAIINGGTIRATGTGSAGILVTGSASNKATLTVNDATLIYGVKYGICSKTAADTKSAITVAGGAINSGNEGVALYTATGAASTVTVTGGTLSGATGIQVMGAVTVSLGTKGSAFPKVTGDGEDVGTHASATYAAGTPVNDGAALSAVTASTSVLSTITVLGGTYTATKASSNAVLIYKGNTTGMQAFGNADAIKAVLIIKGGTFSSNPSAYVDGTVTTPAVDIVATGSVCDKSGSVYVVEQGGTATRITSLVIDGVEIPLLSNVVGATAFTAIPENNILDTATYGKDAVEVCLNASDAIAEISAVAAEHGTVEVMPLIAQTSFTGDTDLSATAVSLATVRSGANSATALYFKVTPGDTVTAAHYFTVPIKVISNDKSIKTVLGQTEAANVAAGEKFEQTAPTGATVANAGKIKLTVTDGTTAIDKDKIVLTTPTDGSKTASVQLYKIFDEDVATNNTTFEAKHVKDSEKANSLTLIAGKKVAFPALVTAADGTTAYYVFEVASSSSDATFSSLSLNNTPVKTADGKDVDSTVKGGADLANATALKVTLSSTQLNSGNATINVASGADQLYIAAVENDAEGNEVLPLMNNAVDPSAPDAGGSISSGTASGGTARQWLDVSSNLKGGTTAQAGKLTIAGSGTAAENTLVLSANGSADLTGTHNATLGTGLKTIYLYTKAQDGKTVGYYKISIEGKSGTSNVTTLTSLSVDGVAAEGIADVAGTEAPSQAPTVSVKIPYKAASTAPAEDLAIKAVSTNAKIEVLNSSAALMIVTSDGSNSTSGALSPANAETEQLGYVDRGTTATTFDYDVASHTLLLKITAENTTTVRYIKLSITVESADAGVDISTLAIKDTDISVNPGKAGNSIDTTKYTLAIPYATQKDWGTSGTTINVNAGKGKITYKFAAAGSFNVSSGTTPTVKEDGTYDITVANTDWNDLASKTNSLYIKTTAQNGQDEGYYEIVFNVAEGKKTFALTAVDGMTDTFTGTASGSLGSATVNEITISKDTKQLTAASFTHTGAVLQYKKLTATADAAAKNEADSAKAAAPFDDPEVGTTAAITLNTAGTTYVLVRVLSEQPDGANYDADANYYLLKVVNSTKSINTELTSLKYKIGDGAETAVTVKPVVTGAGTNAITTTYTVALSNTDYTGTELVTLIAEKGETAQTVQNNEGDVKNGASVKVFAEDTTYTNTYVVKFNVTEIVTYTVSKADTENGSFTVSSESAAEGDEITVTVTPAEGYELATLTYQAEGGTATDIKTALKFTMPAANVTVTATFTAKSEPAPEPSGEVEVTVDETTGKATVSDPAQAAADIAAAIEAAKEGEEPVVSFDADTASSLEIPAAVADALGEGATAEVALKDGTVSIPSAAVEDATGSVNVSVSDETDTAKVPDGQTGKEVAAAYDVEVTGTGVVTSGLTTTPIALVFKNVTVKDGDVIVAVDKDGKITDTYNKADTKAAGTYTYDAASKTLTIYTSHLTTFMVLTGSSGETSGIKITGVKYIGLDGSYKVYELTITGDLTDVKLITETVYEKGTEVSLMYSSPTAATATMTVYVDQTLESNVYITTGIPDRVAFENVEAMYAAIQTVTTAE